MYEDVVFGGNCTYEGCAGNCESEEDVNGNVVEVEAIYGDCMIGSVVVVAVDD